MQNEFKEYLHSNIKELDKFNEIAEIVSHFMLTVGRMHPFKFEIPLHHDKGSFTLDIYLISVPVIEIYFSTYVYERKYRVENNVCRLIYNTVRINGLKEKDLSAFNTLINKLKNGELYKLVTDKLCDFLESVINTLSLFIDDCEIECLLEDSNERY